ncbi:hypothetical protein R0J89_19950, partial [Psychrobacter sp. SIMBA_152]
TYQPDFQLYPDEYKTTLNPVPFVSALGRHQTLNDYADMLLCPQVLSASIRKYTSINHKM